MESLPKIFEIRQKIDAPYLENIETRLKELLDQFKLSEKIKKGERRGNGVTSSRAVAQTSLLKISGF